LGLNFFFISIMYAFKVCVCVCVCVCGYMLTGSCLLSHGGTDTLGLFSLGARKQEPRCSHVLITMATVAMATLPLQARHVKVRAWRLFTEIGGISLDSEPLGTPVVPVLVPVLVLTCPHSSTPMPMKTHHSHWSMARAVQENGFPPN